MKPRTRNMTALSAAVCLALCAVLTHVVNPASARQAPERAVWEVKLAQGVKAVGNININNKCTGPQTFEVDVREVPFLRAPTPPTISVPGKSSREMPVTFDTTALKPGVYLREVRSKCVTCKEERGCHQDRQTIPLRLTVTPAVETRPSVGVGVGADRPVMDDMRPDVPEDSPNLNLGTGVPLVFVEDRPGVGPRFVGTSLGSASLSFGVSSVELALKRNSGDPAATVSQQFVAANPEPSISGVTPGVGVTNVLSGPDPKNWRTNLKQYAAVNYEGLYKGVSVRFEGNGRILKGTYTFAPRAGTTRVAWRYAGAERLLQDKATGNVKVIMPATGRYRVLTLRSPSVRQARGRVSAQYVADKDTLTLSLKDYNPAEELVVETELMYSRHFDDYDARAGREGIYVVGSVPSFGSVPGRAAEHDAFVARLNEKGTGILHLNILDGGADDDAYGLAVSPGGDVYVGGRTNSVRLPVVRPLQEGNHGGYDAFVLRFADGGRSLLGGTYLGGSFDDAIEALTLDCNGEVAVTGTTGHDFPVRADPKTRFATQFPARTNVAAAAACPGRFVGRLSPALDVLQSAEPFTAPPLGRPAKIWKTRDCRLTVGVPSVTADCVATKSYDIGAQYADPAFNADPYINHDVPPLYKPLDTGWGYHALRWKALRNPARTYTPAAATASGFGTYSVSTGDENRLNDAEVKAFAPSDPSGVWQSNYASTHIVLAIGAAYYASRWGSPVYTNVFGYDINNNVSRYAIGIERVTFCVVQYTPGTFQDTPAQQLPALCNFDNVAAGALTVGCNYRNGFFYEFKELNARSWGKSYLVYYSGGAYQNDWDLPWYEKWFEPGIYIGDPPAEEAHLAELFGDAADQLKGAFATKMELEYRAYDAGKLTRSERLSRHVRVADVESAGR